MKATLFKIPRGLSVRHVPKNVFIVHVLLFTALVLAPAGAVDLHLAWDPSPSGTNALGSYTIFGATDPTFGSGVFSRTVPSNQNTVGFTNLVGGATYYFYGVATATNGVNSDPGNTVTNTNPLPMLRLRVTTQVAPAPAGPWSDTTNVQLVALSAAAGKEFYRTRLDLEPAP